MRSEREPPACPVCGGADQTQPVQAIVAQQVTHTAGGGATVGLGWAGHQVVPVVAAHRAFSTARSPLAAMLDLPRPPRPRNLAVWGGLLSAALVLLPLAFGLLLSGLGTVDDSSPWTATLAFLAALSPGIVVGVVLVAVGVGRQRAWRRQVAWWQRALPVWATLRYCHRDHVVYQPPNLHFAPAETRRFVYGASGDR